MLRTLLVEEAARVPAAKPSRAAAWVRILVEGRSGSGAEEAAIAPRSRLRSLRRRSATAGV